MSHASGNACKWDLACQLIQAWQAGLAARVGQAPAARCYTQTQSRLLVNHAVNDEAALLAGALALDARVLGQVHDRYYPELYRFALYRTGDPATAEDIAAEVFVRLLDAAHAGRLFQRSPLPKAQRQHVLLLRAQPAQRGLHGAALQMVLGLGRQ